MLKQSFLVATCTILLAGIIEASNYRGSVHLTVADESGHPVEGAGVSLAGPGPARAGETDREGRVRFQRLAPGAYSIEVSKAGFSTSVYEGVALNARTDLEMNLTLRSGDGTQRHVVGARTRILDRRRTERTVALESTELTDTPNARSPWALLSTIPGLQVDRFNVGGGANLEFADWSGLGNRVGGASWEIEGVDLTDVEDAGQSLAFFDFNSLQEIAVTTGGASDLELTNGGPRFAFMTRQGTNRHSGSVGVYFTDDGLVGSAQAKLQPDGNPTRSIETNKVLEKSLQFSGPIVPGRIWYWIGVAEKEVVLSRPAGGGAEILDETKWRGASGKLNGTVGEKFDWKFFWTRGERTREGIVALNRPPETTTNLTGPVPIATVDATYFVRPNLDLSLQLSTVGGGFKILPLNNAAQMRWDSNFVWRDTWISYVTDRSLNQVAARGNWFVDAGKVAHEFRFGFKYKDAEVQSFSRYGLDQVVAVEWASQAWLYRGVNTRTQVEDTTLWFGDSMLWNSWMFDVGASWEMQQGEILSSTSPANGVCPSCLPAISFSGQDPGFEWSDLLTRVGGTYVFDGPRRQLIRASHSRYVDRLGAQEIDGNNPVRSAEIDYAWTDLNNDNQVQLGEFDSNCMTGPVFVSRVDPCAPTSPIAVDFVDTELKAPRVQELVLGYEIELQPDLALGVRLVARDRSHTLWEPLVDLLTVPVGFVQGQSTQGIDILNASDWSAGTLSTGPIACYSPIGPCMLSGQGQAFTVQAYRLNDAAVLAGRTDSTRRSILTNRPGLTEEYRGLELTVVKRLSNRWRLRGFFALQDWTRDITCNATAPTGECVDGPGIQSPADIVGEGTRPGGDAGVLGGTAGAALLGSSSWQYHVNFMYELPKNFRISGGLSGREGYEIPHYVRRDEFTLVGVERQRLSVSGYRYDDVHLLDVGGAYRLDLGKRSIIDFRLDVFNMLDDDTITQLEPRLAGGSSGLLLEQTNSRLVRAAVSFSF